MEVSTMVTLAVIVVVIVYTIVSYNSLVNVKHAVSQASGSICGTNCSNLRTWLMFTHRAAAIVLANVISPRGPGKWKSAPW